MGSKRKMLTIREDPEFDRMLDQSAESFKALPPEEQERVLASQRLSAGRSAFPRRERR